MTDPIADMITRIRNAYLAKKASVRIPHSNLKEQLAKKLESLGYIQQVEVSGEAKEKVITTGLIYQSKTPILTAIKRMSSPGGRQYTSKKNIPSVLSGHGAVILTTSQGIMTDKEAKKAGVGGEIILKVW